MGALLARDEGLGLRSAQTGNSCPPRGSAARAGLAPLHRSIRPAHVRHFLSPTGSRGLL